jgi:16S rRNA processing protein RimM
MTPEWDSLVAVGVIARPHGLRGHVLVNLETDFPEERYHPGAELWVLRGGKVECLTVRDVRFHHGRPLVGFEGFDTIEAIEAVGRLELRADPATFGPLPEDTFRHSDLVGCEVVTREGTVLGPVTKVDGQFMSNCLVVQFGQREVMIPLAAHICVEIDTAGRRIVVDPPEGLLDL